MKKTMLIVTAAMALATSTLATELKCTNLDKKNVSRSVICSADMNCILSSKSNSSNRGIHIPLSALRADRTTITMENRQSNLLVILTHRQKDLLAARVSVAGAPIAFCQ